MLQVPKGFGMISKINKQMKVFVLTTVPHSKDVTKTTCLVGPGSDYSIPQTTGRDIPGNKGSRAIQALQVATCCKIPLGES